MKEKDELPPHWDKVPFGVHKMCIPTDCEPSDVSDVSINK